MVNRAVIRASVRLKKKRTLMAMSSFIISKVGCVRAGAVELINAAFAEKEESCADMCSKILRERSAGSGRSEPYDSTLNAVATAEKRPAYTVFR